MDLKFKNLVAVIAVLGLMIIALISYYFGVSVGALTIGSVAGIADDTALGLSNTSQAVITGTETAYASNVTSANAVVPLAIGLLSVVAILLIFGWKGGFGMGKSKGGVN